VMKRSWLLLACVLPSMCFAQTVVNYKLYGDYIAQLGGGIKIASWSYTSGCTDSNNKVHVASGGAWLPYPGTAYGTLTFNGTTGVSASITRNVFDKSKSNATVTITWSTDGDCVPTINNGHAVFDPPATASATGSYSINATTGIGTLTLSVSGGAVVAQFQTTGSFASCASGGTIYVIPNTIMLEVQSKSTPNLADTGIAQHANGILMTCPF